MPPPLLLPPPQLLPCCCGCGCGCCGGDGCLASLLPTALCCCLTMRPLPPAPPTPLLPVGRCAGGWLLLLLLLPPQKARNERGERLRLVDARGDEARGDEARGDARGDDARGDEPVVTLRCFSAVSSVGEGVSGRTLGCSAGSVSAADAERSIDPKSGEVGRSFERPWARASSRVLPVARMGAGLDDTDLSLIGFALIFDGPPPDGTIVGGMLDIFQGWRLPKAPGCHVDTSSGLQKKSRCFTTICQSGVSLVIRGRLAGQ